MLPPPTIALIDARLEFNGQLLFDHLNLAIPSGEWTCLLGPSGVGKTSLLRLIAGLSENANSSYTLQTSDNISLAGRLSYLSQNETLLPWLTVLENVVIGSKLRGQK